MKKWTIIWNVRSYRKHSLETGKREYFYMCNCHCTFYITTWFNMPFANSRQDSKFKSYFRNLFTNVKTASLIHAIQEFKFHTLHLRSCSLYSDFLQRHRILSNKLLTNCLFKESCYLSNILRKISTPCWKVLPLAHIWQTMVLVIIF